MAGLETHRAQPFLFIKEKIRAYLQRQRWKEALVFFWFVLLAFGFWLLQSLQQEYEIALTIPVRYANVPVDIAFNGKVPQSVTAKVKDKGSMLLNYSFGRKFSPVEINLKETAGKDGKLMVSRKEIEEVILKQLLSSTLLLETTPAPIEISYSKREQKSVPVRFNGTIETDPGFQLADEISFKPAMVQVFAGKALLDTLQAVHTLPLVIKHGNRGILRSVQLEKIEGANLSPTAVMMTIPIEEYTEKTLDIPVQCLHVPHRYTVRLFPSSVRVNCSVPLSRFKELTEAQFTITIPYEELELHLNGTIPVSLSKKPEWVHTATLVPDKVEFILEQNNLNE